VSELAISFVVYVCVTGGALAGIYLNPVLPPEHVKDETRQAVNIAVGIIATLAALVLGLMVTSAKSSFDTRASDVREIAARIIILDRVLRDYGHEATDARDQLKTMVEARMEHFWAEEFQAAGAPRLTDMESGFRRRLLSLSPANDTQKWLQARALTVAGDLEQTRWLLIEQSRKTIPRADVLACRHLRHAGPLLAAQWHCLYDHLRLRIVSRDGDFSGARAGPAIRRRAAGLQPARAQRTRGNQSLRIE